MSNNTTAAANRPEAGLYLFTSNRLEVLAAKLARRLLAPALPPLQEEILVVRNQGMERWLKLQLAAGHGVSANQRFYFPEDFAQQIFRAVLPGHGSDKLIDRDVLFWRALSALPKLIEQPEFLPLRNYLGASRDQRQSVQLAGKIAGVFDQYLVFRPDLVLGWDQGQDDHWQATLWRAMTGGIKAEHSGSLWKQFKQAIPQLTAPGALPSRLTIFGVSALPPFYLDLFVGLARHLQVNLFLLQPSQEYWGEITSPREEERLLRRQDKGAAAAFELHLETGNRLLASMGYLGRDFIKLLLDAGDWMADETFVAPGEQTLLRCVQSDILTLRDRGRDDERGGSDASAAAAGDTPRTPLERVDDSIQVHSCHTPLREMEVLYDQMLDWFQRDPTLRPREIVVMTPDIEIYTPFIQAVFGSPEEHSRAIPFAIADRGMRRQSLTTDTFLELLSLADTRLGNATVLTLLDTPALRSKFGLLEDDLETLRRWVLETQISWGIDAEHRGRLGLPELRGYTWRHGLDRLLLGYGMGQEKDRAFQGILPADEIEGNDALLLGRFLEFFERLVKTLGELRTARTLPEWATTLQDVLDRFFQASEESALELQVIRDVLADLRRQAAWASFDGTLELPALLERLVPLLEEDRHRAGFLTGGVTFCGLKPMRSIPFRVVCLVGLNDGAFPRATQHLGFDLMTQAPRLGDRSTREDDRYLFLETLLSARDRLFISYLGQSVRDNSPAPPSVLVSELLDYLKQGFQLRGTDSLEDRLVTRHRLQAFSEHYFQPDGRLFSYSRENCQASRSTRQPRGPVSLFMPERLAEPEPALREVTLENLARFLTNPAKYFLTRRLAIYLPENPPQIEERERFLLDSLDRHDLKQESLRRQLDDQTENAARALADAAGQLPLGTVGQTQHASVWTAAERLAAQLRPRQSPQPPGPIEIDSYLGPFHLTGRILPGTEAGLLRYRCADIKPNDMLRLWVQHLAVNLVRPGCTSTLLGEDGLRLYSAPSDPDAILRDLLELYWQGLQLPLTFFPRSSLAFVEAETLQETSARSRSTPLQKARGEWDHNFFQDQPGESENLYFERCFRGRSPLDEIEFSELARRVYQPLLRHEQRGNT